MNIFKIMTNYFILTVEKLVAGVGFEPRPSGYEPDELQTAPPRVRFQIMIIISQSQLVLLKNITRIHFIKNI